MKKIIVSGIVIITFALYAIFYHKSSSIVSTSTGESNSGAGTTSSSVTSSKTPTQTKNRQYKDGAYTGTVANAYYGMVQIKATIQDGKISDVEFLQYPNDQEESQQVSQASIPTLKQEAIQAQNANVDIVTGATQTSQAFKE